MNKPLVHYSSVFLSLLLISACQNSVDTATDTSNDKKKTPLIAPQFCAQPAPVHDIWKLEPILIKRGEINDSMSKAQKEKKIRAYIAEKNAQYQICLKGSKKS